ncbi:MAG: tetratricopeptide repeat protein [Spirochaetaceae bacterium]|nr:MAG: tetratricopeptide repeat protein [Spirochaetaceae bacterium]
MMLIQLLMAAVLSLSSLQQGEQLFLENKPREALPHLEKALYENPQEEKIYLYLGIVYEQLNDTEKSIQILKRGLNVSQGYKDLFYYNLGNNHFRMQEFTVAEQMYSNALKINGSLEVAYLNRANARLELEEFQDARQDYIDYLRLDPDTPQRENIEKLIALLAQIMEEAERARLEELERQKALLNEVLDTLKNASEDTRNLSAGTEDIQKEYEEIDIED